MARIRTIKPEFFTDAKIVKLSHVARLFFIGLFCHVDRRGRFEWKPDDLKMRIMPIDKESGEEILGELETVGLIVPYCDRKYGYIPTFEKHQHIGKREPESRIPSIDECDTEQVHVPAKAGTKQVHVPDGREGKGRERKGRERKNTNTLAMQASPEDQKFIVDIIDLWAEVFDDKEMVKRWYANKTQREAILSLRTRLKSEQKLIDVVRHIPEMIQIPYIPKMSTPYLLNANLIDIVAKFKQDGNTTKSKGKGIISKEDITS